MALPNIPPGYESQEKDVEKMADMSKIQSNGNGQVFESGGTKRSIKNRHAQMIAIGGTIGTSLFVATGQALAVGGPGILLIAYVVMAFMVYGVVTAVIEVGAHLPVPGATMSMHCGRYMSKSLGIALGYLYVYSFGIIAAYELTAATIIIDFWPHNVHVAVWITILMAVIIALKSSPSGCLLIMSLVLMLGGGPNHERLGFRYWYDPGAMNESLVSGASGRFVAFLRVWILSGFSFYFGPELIIVTSGEMQNPRKNLPIASRQFFYRLIFFYVLSAVAIGAICASNSPGLVSGAGNADASPWVIAIRNAGIEVLPSVVNAGILTSAWSSGSAYLYMSSRSLYSLAVSGHAPRFLAKCSQRGVPYNSVLTAALFLPLSYMVCNSEAGVVFNWFINLTNTAGYTSWILCCATFIRFRKACVAHGITSPYQSPIQPWAAWICMILFAILCLLNGFTVLFPGEWSTGSFFSAYIGIPIFLCPWLGHKFTSGKNDPWMLSPQDIDLTTGLSLVRAEAEMFEEEAAASQRSRFMRFMKSRSGSKE
ncbi:hypothetical protein Daus18300_000512 [Diaporthe australafricana]|uniref:Amino acid permease/ SLC12A domain-containing protein n=1 Tax=Diaporthe australafricana TaxID=127596 RepID=A0ABR3Y573_9PEZI